MKILYSKKEKVVYSLMEEEFAKRKRDGFEIITDIDNPLCCFMSVAIAKNMICLSYDMIESYEEQKPRRGAQGISEVESEVKASVEKEQ
jgi:hypothetical protein